MTRLLLAADSSLPERCDDCQFAIVDVTPALVKRWRRWFELAKELQEKERDLYELYFWGSPAYYFDCTEEFCELTDSPEFDDLRRMWLPDDLKIETAESRIECAQTVLRVDRNDTVKEGEIVFYCLPKHVSCQITTEAVSLNVLERQK